MFFLCQLTLQLKACFFFAGKCFPIEYFLKNFPERFGKALTVFECKSELYDLFVP